MLQGEKRGQQVEVVGAEDGGRVATVTVGQWRDGVVVVEVFFPRDGHVPDSLHFVLGGRDHFALAKHPVDFVLLAKETERLEEEITNLQVNVSVTRLGDLLDFGQLFKAFGNN